VRPALLLTAACVALAGCNEASSPRPAPHAPAVARRHARHAAPGRRSIRPPATAGRPVYCGGHRPYAALTFDDGPGVYTRLALRILRRAHVRATFFLVGRNLPRWSGLAKAETPTHLLANHTYTHPVLPALSPAAASTEISSTTAAIRRETGVHVRLFRPPYGLRNPEIDAIARRQGLTEVLWNVDSGDSAGANYARIARNVEAGIGPGAIVLMHENHGQTIRALKFLILPSLRRRHIHLVTVSALLARDPPTAAQLRAGRAGCARRGARGTGG
jgi:peptidoglycan/xylan/chitin deacetylase (PgdA/CDA1 family)